MKLLILQIVFTLATASVSSIANNSCIENAKLDYYRAIESCGGVAPIEPQPSCKHQPGSERCDTDPVIAGLKCGEPKMAKVDCRSYDGCGVFVAKYSVTKIVHAPACLYCSGHNVETTIEEVYDERRRACVAAGCDYSVSTEKLGGWPPIIRYNLNCEPK